jgi:hypothetical protein
MISCKMQPVFLPVDAQKGWLKKRRRLWHASRQCFPAHRVNYIKPKDFIKLNAARFEAIDLGAQHFFAGCGRLL